MKKFVSILTLMILTAALFAGCSAPNNFDNTNEISVIRREAGSGTHGAFVELFGIEVKAEDGTKADQTTLEATTTNNTESAMTNVANDEYAIGYISLGSRNDTVKLLKIDGAEATAANIKNGVYKVSRPFSIATKGEPTGLAKDFIEFIRSKEGQAVVAGGYIPVDDAAAPYAGTKPEGKIVIAGSSSVSPIMQKLIEAYQKVNGAASIELQASDSTTGMNNAMDGTCDIGMASRELKESELAVLKGSTIAVDGIAVIVNPQNPLSGLTKEQVKDIYTGGITSWDGLA